MVGIRNSAPVMMPRLAMIDSTQASAAQAACGAMPVGLLGPGGAARRQRAEDAVERDADNDDQQQGQAHAFISTREAAG